MKRYLLFIYLLIFYQLLFAQQLQPEHPMYVSPFLFSDKEMHLVVKEWVPGTKYREDDNFFISRVKFKERISNPATDPLLAVPNTATDVRRKVLWWCPVGEPFKAWQCIPRYNFNADVFSLWSYIDTHGGWGLTPFSVPGAFADVANKNGVKNGALQWFGASMGDIIDGLYGASNGSEVEANAKKFLQLMKYYGFSCIGYNGEERVTATQAGYLQDFHAKLYELSKQEGTDWYLPEFQVVWYDSALNNGNVSWRDQLDNDNKGWFRKNGQWTSDCFFTNYNWTQTKLTTSKNTANSFGGDGSYPYAVYSGFSLQTDGGLRGKFPGSWGWLNSGDGIYSSIGFWGAHDMNMILRNSTENGASDVPMQEEYQKKQELMFCGGNNNPQETPAIRDDASLSMTSLKQFNGLAKFVNGKSTLNELPFITRFNLGNGVFFNNEGKTTFNQQWYNWGIQDFMPTWRWWVLNETNTAIPANPIKIDFQFKDAWFGGSCPRFHGQTATSNVRLFKTDFSGAENADISITYKLKNGTDSKMKLFYSKVGSENAFTTIDVGNAEQGKWHTFTAPITGLAAGEKIALLGIRFENTAADYDMLLGEMSIIPKNSTFPKLVPAEILSAVKLSKDGQGSTYNTQDFKVIWQAQGKNAYAVNRVTNDQVDTWYWEVYIKEEGQDSVLLTATTSWAAYVVNAPIKVPGSNISCGVRAVALDGKTKSPITWASLGQHVYKPSAKISIDKSIIKPNEEFVIGFVDITKSGATWVIKDNAGTAVKNFADQTSIATQLPTIGFYSLEVTHTPQGGTEQTDVYKDFIVISPEAVGALPVAGNLTADKTQFGKNEDVVYTGQILRMGEGGSSTGFKFSDPQTLQTPASLITTTHYTLCAWLKFENLSGEIHLFSKRNITESWTMNEWGEIWTGYNVGAKALSIGTKTGTSSAGDVGASDIELLPLKWYHIAFTRNATTLTIYLNGKKVAEKSGLSSQSFSSSRPIYFGGTAYGRSGFTGWMDDYQIWNKALTVDELKTAMEGYHGKSIPENLVGYYTFEEGKNGARYTNKGTLASADLRYGQLKGSIDVEEQTIEDANEDVGCPLLGGNKMVKTVYDFEFEDGTGTIKGVAANDMSDKSQTTQFIAVGQKKVTFKLSNDWSNLQDVRLWSGNIKEISADVLDFSVSPTEKTLNTPLAGTVEFQVVGTTWEVKIPADCNWLQTSDGNTSYTGNQTLVFNLTQNNTPDNRSVDVVLRNTSINVEKTITIHQVKPTLSVSPSSLLFSLTGVTNYLTISTNSSWEVSTTNSWITLPTPSTGTETKRVQITLQAPHSEREGVITVKVPGLPDMNIPVKQTAPTIELPTNVSVAAANGSEAVVPVSSNTQWKVESVNVNWLSIQSGETGENNDNTVFVVTQNTTGSQRQATVTYVSIDGLVAQKTLTITQEKPQLSVNYSTLQPFASEQSQQTLNIMSNTNWQITSNASWLTISPSVDKLDKEVALMVEKNSSALSRKGSITVQSQGIESPVTFEVTQDGGAVILQVEEPGVMSKSASFATISVTSNTSWKCEVTEGASWLSIVSGSEGLNNGKINIKVLSNESNQRQGKINLFSTAPNTTESVLLTIVQSGQYNLSATVDKVLNNVSGDGGVISIVSNLTEDEKGWRLEMPSDIAWLEFDMPNLQNTKVIEGFGNQEVKVKTLRPNAASVVRNANLTLSAINNLLGIPTYTLTVKQAGAEDPTGIRVEKDINSKVYPNPTTNILQIMMTEGRLAERIVVANISGIIVLDKKLDNVDFIEIDMSVYPTGIYTINVYLPGNKVMIKKVTKI